MARPRGRSPAVSAVPAAPEAASPLAVAAVVLLATIALAVRARGFLPFIADDALISLHYARRLLDGHGLTWVDGERVEGYSNLLWTLGAAALGRFGIDLVVAARALGIACTMAIFAALALAHRPARPTQAVPALAAALALALSGPIGVWSIGGLEQPMVGALLAWGLVLSYPLLASGAPVPARAALAPGVPLALLCLTRSDGALFTAALALGLIAARGVERRTFALAFTLAALPAAAVLAQLGVRLAYYGDWLPNPAYAKVALTPERLAAGARYLASGVAALAPIVVAAVFAAIAALRSPGAARVRLLAVVLCVWAAYVVVIGGDIFPAWRHLVPALAILALVIVEGAWALAESARGPRPGAAWAALAIGVPALLALTLLTADADPEVARARSERWEWDGAEVGHMLRGAFAAERPLLAVDPAGCMAYFSGLPVLDMLGLNDRFLGHHRPSDIGRHWLGHELGNGPYVMSREPALVLMCLPTGSPSPCFRSGIEMLQDPGFAQRYRLVRWESAGPRPVTTTIWARAEGGPIGVRRAPERVEVPGWLLAIAPVGIARPGGDGRLTAVVTDRVPAAFGRLELGAGPWRVRVLAQGEPVTAEVRVSGDTLRLARGIDPPPFPFAGGRVDLVLTGQSPAETRVAGVEFVRIATRVSSRQ